MINNKLRVISVLLLCFICFASLVGCDETPADDDSVIIAAFKELYPVSAVLNQAVYGSGFELKNPDAERDYKVSHYEQVSESCPYQTIADFQTAINSTFSAGYAEAMSLIMFNGLEYDSDTLSGFQPRYNEIDGVLAMDVMYGGASITSTVDLNNIAVKEKSALACTLTVGYVSETSTVTSIDVKMVKENGKWLLDSATY